MQAGEPGAEERQSDHDGVAAAASVAAVLGGIAAAGTAAAGAAAATAPVTGAAGIAAAPESRKIFVSPNRSFLHPCFFFSFTLVSHFVKISRRMR